MKYFVTDVETGVKNRGEYAVGDMKASPYCIDNKLVLYGERHKKLNSMFDPWVVPSNVYIPASLVTARTEPVLIVGANLAFDLKYIVKTYDMTWPQVLNNIYIWDVQQVAYLLSGQTHMYPSLDEMCTEIGYSLKDEKIKEYWDAGVDTEDIPRDELLTYLAHDLEGTEAVFLHQYEIVSKIPALFSLVKVKMDDILCTSMMELNGMQFDLEVAYESARKNDIQIKSSRTYLQAAAMSLFDSRFEFNPMSPDHVSLALFGGGYTIRMPVVVLDEAGKDAIYKTGIKKGMVKTRMEDVAFTTAGLGLSPKVACTSKPGIYPVGEAHLKEFGSSAFANTVLTLRELEKENETYYRGYSSLVWPDNKIHCSINHCSTRTGRQSCTRPNLQNVTREE